MNTVVADDSAPVSAPSALWGIAFCIGCAAIVALLIAAALFPDFRNCAMGTYHALYAAVEQSVLTRLPASLHAVAKDILSLALSPLVYVVLVLVFLAEKFIPADRRHGVFSRGMIQDSIAWFVLDSVLKAAISVTCLALAYLVFETCFSAIRISDQWASLIPSWTRVVAALLLIDLMSWLHHYLHHKVRFLWFFHSVHHSQREMNLFTDLRFHAIEFVTLGPMIFAPLYVLNLDFRLAAWIVCFQLWYPRIYHANLRSNFGPLRYLLVTPQSHRVHHSRQRQHIDKNFATLFSFWDRLFDTQWTNYAEYPETGIDDQEFPLEDSVTGMHVFSNYFSQLIYPFQCVIRALSRKTSA